MKKIFLYILVISLFSCEGFIIKEDEAKKTAEALLTLIQNEEYEKTSDYYSPEFNESEPLEKRTYKFEQLKTVTGSRTSFELIESRKETIDERDVFILTYKVICEKVELKDVLIVGLEEGKHLVLRHTTTNQEVPA